MMPDCQIVLEMAAFVVLTTLNLSSGLHSHSKESDPSVIHGSSKLEKRLYWDLMTGYNSISRPVTHATERVHLTFGLSLNQILDLDAKHQILSSYVWIYESWTDPSLVWDPDDYRGLDVLVFPATSIWVPDIYIFNVAGSSTEGFVNVSGSKVRIRPNGHVTWSVPLHINSACPVDATFFPYDKQVCDIHFGSWIYDLSQIDIFLGSQPFDTQNYVVNNEFDLYNTNIYRSIVNNSCCPGTGKHPMIHLSLTLKRKTNYYDYIVIAPTINLCVLTLATFLLPCECGWKIAIGLTVFLNLYVLQLLIAENVPDTNSTPLISVFLQLVMSLNCVSLITATIIMNVKRRSLKEPPPPVPPLLLAVCEKYLSRVVCTNVNDWKRIADTPKYVEEHVQIFPPADDIFDIEEEEEPTEQTEQTREEYIQLQDLVSNSSSDSTGNQVSEISDVMACRYNDECTGATAESSFSCTSTNETYSNDNSFTDLISKPKPKPSVNTYGVTNTGCARKGNYYYSIDTEDNMCGIPTGSDAMTCTEMTYLRSQKFSRPRPSYRKAIKSGHSVKFRRPRRASTPKQASSTSWVAQLDRKYQWYFVADVIDTTTFMVYLTVMFVGIIAVLVITPMYA